MAKNSHQVRATEQEMLALRAVDARVAAALLDAGRLDMQAYAVERQRAQLYEALAKDFAELDQRATGVMRAHGKEPATHLVDLQTGEIRKRG